MSQRYEYFVEEFLVPFEQTCPNRVQILKSLCLWSSTTVDPKVMLSERSVGVVEACAHPHDSQTKCPRLPHTQSAGYTDKVSSTEVSGMAQGNRDFRGELTCLPSIDKHTSFLDQVRAMMAWDEISCLGILM